MFDGELGGRVTFDSRPVENILVAIDRRPDGSHLPTIEVFTAADGTFSVQGVLPGSYCIRYSDPNGIYATNNYGKHSVNGSCDRITLEAGEARTNLDHRLALAGSISGEVAIYGGGATENIEVIAYVYHTQAKEWRSTEIKTKANKNGQYRLAGLLPKAYRLGFRDTSDSTIRTQPNFYGSGYSVGSASSLPVNSGQEMSNVDYVLGLFQQMKPQVYLPLAAQAR